MTKKELQNEIDELRKRIDKLEAVLTIGDMPNKLSTILKTTREILYRPTPIYHYDIMSGVIECDSHTIDFKQLHKQFLALLDYLKIEYQEEDKHIEGFKKIK